MELTKELKEQILTLFNSDERPDLELAICRFNENYIITNYGDVISFFRGKLLRIKSDLNNGYVRYKMQTGPKKSSFFGHRLVAIHFIPTEGDFEDLVVNHVDGNRVNNYYKNLEWCTPSENSNHAYWHRRGKVDLETYEKDYKNKLHGYKHVNKTEEEKTKRFNIKNTGLPKKTSVDSYKLDKYNTAIRKGLHIPMEAFDLEVFAIKPNPEGQPGKQAFIGYKLPNDDFGYIQVPYTEKQENENKNSN